VCHATFSEVCSLTAMSAPTGSGRRRRYL
jgi:hypothetical protein